MSIMDIFVGMMGGPSKPKEAQAEEPIFNISNPTDHAADAIRYAMKNAGITQKDIDDIISPLSGRAWHEAEALSSGVFKIKRRSTMADDDLPLFQVFKVANGFYARMASGKMVVGATLSEVTTAASAQATSDHIQNEESGIAALRKGPKPKAKTASAWKKAIADEWDEEEEVGP